MDMLGRLKEGAVEIISEELKSTMTIFGDGCAQREDREPRRKRDTIKEKNNKELILFFFLKYFVCM